MCILLHLAETIFSTLFVKRDATDGEFRRKNQKLRKEKTSLKKQLADLADVAISVISAYESGNRYPHRSIN